MMGSENQSLEEHPLSESKEEMENLVLHEDDPLISNSYSNYRSAISTFSESHHPPSIVSTPADSDPLLSPPQHYRDFPNPNSQDSSSYIDPPSYADAVFSPFDGDSASNGVDSPILGSDGLSLSRSPSSSSEYLKITVSNPVKEQENSNLIVPGSNSYETYLITTRTNIPDFCGSEFSVRRRFRDVVPLSDRLVEVYRGFFVPPRPDKSIVESQAMQKQATFSPAFSSPAPAIYHPATCFPTPHGFWQKTLFAQEMVFSAGERIRCLMLGLMVSIVGYCGKSFVNPPGIANVHNRSDYPFLYRWWVIDMLAAFTTACLACFGLVLVPERLTTSRNFGPIVLAITFVPVAFITDAIFHSALINALDETLYDVLEAFQLFFYLVYGSIYTLIFVVPITVRLWEQLHPHPCSCRLCKRINNN